MLLVRRVSKRYAIDGTVYLVNDRAPALSMEDVVERGQIGRAGKFVPLGDYDPFAAVRVPNSSVNLNHAQIRNFTSVPELTRYLEARGFARSAGAGLQPGDPTKNTLMLFVKRA